MTTKRQIMAYISLLTFMLLIFLYVVFIEHQPTQIISMWPGAKLPDKSSVESQVQQNYNDKPSRFLVMIQVDKCPSNLTAEDKFRNVKKCNCDVLVLTYKEKCVKPHPTTHIEYIIHPGTTWNTGRNLMLEVGRNRTEKYLYYIL